MRGTYGDDVWLNAWIEQESFQLHTQRIEVETCSNRQRSVLTSTTHIPTTCYITTSSRLYLLLSTTQQLHLIHRVGGINKTSTHQRPVTHRCSTAFMDYRHGSITVYSNNSHNTLNSHLHTVPPRAVRRAGAGMAHRQQCADAVC